jgi:arylsulfatase A-like enzyme
MANASYAAEHPNVVLIVTDDQGWGDVRTHGNEIMRLDEVTLGEAFAAAGYTTGAFGKWHNGQYGPYHPNHRGFHEFFGFCRGSRRCSCTGRP